MAPAIQGLAAAVTAIGIAVAAWGATDLARSNPALQTWFATILVAVGAALVLGSVITLVVLVFRARRKKATPEPTPPPPQPDITPQHSPGTIVNPQASVTQYIGVQPPSPDLTTPTYWLGRPPSLGTAFVGRKKDIEAISDAFDTHNAVVISGGAGSGKSRLAAEYTHQAKVQGFWTPAGNSVVETLVALGTTLGVRMTERSNEEIAGEVGRRLAELAPETLWVVDNLNDIALVNGLLSEAGDVRLLITTRDSRNHLLPAAVAHHPTVALSQEAAIALLRSRSQSKVPADHTALAPIAQKVGSLPLALEVLAAQLGEARRTPESILVQLERAPTAIQMDAFQEASGASIPRPEAEGVFAAIARSLEDLSAEDRGALAGLAYIADAPVPDLLAVALTGLDSEGLTDLLSRCSRQSLLSWSDAQVSAHALTVAALAATNPDGGLAVVLARARVRLTQINKDDPVALRSEVVHYETIHSQAQRRLGPDEDSVLSFANSLAVGHTALGHIQEAIGLDEKILDARERLLGPEHPDTLHSRNNLAVDYRDAGRNEDATRLDEQTLGAMERVLGPEHPDTLANRNNLASGYRDAGRTEDAIRLDEQTLEVRERVMGTDHPDTLASRNNLANGYRDAGRIEDANRLHEQTLEVMERVLGPEHPDTLVSRNNLAAGYRAAGRTEDAIRLHEQTLAARERVLGPEHPDTLASRSNLAIGYRAAGRTEDAIKLDEQTLEARERVLGSEHPDTLASRSNLAIAYRAAGRTEDTERLESRE